MIFKSRQINLDPEPWVGPPDNSATKRYAEQGDPRMGRKHRPRPEFEPTRDPKPYECGMKPNQDVRHPRSDIRFCGKPIWSPRREQFDTPANNLLRAFRASGKTAADFLAQVDEPGWILVGSAWTPNMVKHAHRVLTRLVNLSVVTL